MKNTSPVMISWKPNKKNSMPVYRQIVRFICDKVADGEWPIGTRLPSQRALADQFEVNRSTISTAIDELASYGIISGKTGAGTQIVSNTWALMLPTTTNWKKFISAGYFQENQHRIQQINHWEFAPDIVRLGTGELDPRLFPQKMWSQILQKLSTEITSLGYAEPLGLLDLRVAISKHMKNLGIDAKPQNILVTSGALQALQLIASCLLEDGSTVFTEAPSYLKSLETFQSMGLNLNGIPMDQDGMEYWKIAKRLKDAESILYTIPTNHNPTGTTMSNARREELMDFCIKNRLPIIEDGVYQELCFDDEETPKSLKAMDKNGMVMYLGSASKALAPGLRIGWIVASEPVIERLGDAKMQMDYGASSLSQLVFAEFLNSGMYDEYLLGLRKELQKRRDNALQILERDFKDIATWNHPIGGFYIWLTFNENINVENLFDDALKAGILLNPGDIYDFKRNRSIRLSFAYVTCGEFRVAMGKLNKIIVNK